MQMFRGSNYSIDTDKDTLNRSQLYQEDIHINFLGASHVGKSSMLSCIEVSIMLKRLIISDKISEAQQTSQQYIKYKLEIQKITNKPILSISIHSKNQIIFVQWDADGDLMQDYIQQDMFDRCDGIIEVFQIGDISSFYQLQNLHFLLKRKLTNKIIPIIIAGNKIDQIIQTQQNNDILTQCNYLAQKFAKRQQILYLKTSAKNNTSVKDCFVQLIKQILIQRYDNGSGSGRRIKSILEQGIKMESNPFSRQSSQNKQDQMTIKDREYKYQAHCQCCRSAVKACNKACDPCVIF